MSDFYYKNRQIKALRYALQYSEEQIQIDKSLCTELASLYNELFNNQDLLPLTKISPLDLPKISSYFYKIGSVAIYLASENFISLTVLQNVLVSIFTTNIENTLCSRMFSRFVEFIIEQPNNKGKLFQILFEIVFHEVISSNINKQLTILIQELLVAYQSLIVAFEDGVVLYSHNHEDELGKQIVILKFLIRLQHNYSTIEIIHDEIIWFLIGQALVISTWINHRQVFEEMRNWGIEFVVANVPTIIRNILHTRPQESIQDIHSFAKLLRNFSGAIIEELGGPENVLPALLEWYRSEENKTFRLAFHYSYILIMREGYAEDVLLTVTAPFVRYEQDIDILLKIFESLIEFIHWHKLSHIVQLILDHPQLENTKLDVIDSKLIKPYFEELSTDVQFLGQTQDIFIRFWENRLIYRGIRQQLLKYLKKWIEKTNSPSKTIKGVFIQTLIRRTQEENYLNILTHLLESLGPLKVHILDDYVDRTNITILKD